MKKAILILALSTQAAFAGGNAGKQDLVTKQVVLNGQTVYIQGPANVVSKSAQPGFLKYAVRKPKQSPYADGLRRSLLRSNFR